LTAAPPESAFRLFDLDYFPDTGAVTLEIAPGNAKDNGATVTPVTAGSISRIMSHKQAHKSNRQTG